MKQDAVEGGKHLDNNKRFLCEADADVWNRTFVLWEKKTIE